MKTQVVSRQEVIDARNQVAEFEKQRHISLQKVTNTPVILEPRDELLSRAAKWKPSLDHLESTRKAVYYTYVVERYYKPSFASYKGMDEITIQELRRNQVHEDVVLYGRVIVPPVWIGGDLTVIEDTNGDVMRLCIYHRSSKGDEGDDLRDGSIVAIKQPHVVALDNSRSIIQVDHTGDFAILAENDPDLPEQFWRPGDSSLAWIDRGAKAQHRGDWLFSVECFDRALQHTPFKNRALTDRIVMHRLVSKIALGQVDSVLMKDAKTLFPETIFRNYHELVPRLVDHPVFASMAWLLKVGDLNDFADVIREDPAEIERMRPVLLWENEVFETLRDKVNLTVEASTIAGLGVRAREAIAPGNVVMVERSLLKPSMEHKSAILDLVEPLQKITFECASPLYSMVRTFALHFGITIRHLNLPCGAYTRDKRDVLLIDNLPQFDTFHLLHIYYVCMHGDMAREPVGKTNLFYVSCFLNHACVPNAFAHVKGGNITVRAIRRIEPREEVTVAYCHNAVPSHQRQKLLITGYGFYCRCLQCLHEEKEPMYQALREEIIALYVEGLRRAPDGPGYLLDDKFNISHAITKCREIAATYDKAVHGFRPRTLVAYMEDIILRVYMERKDLRGAKMHAFLLLEALGWIIRFEGSPGQRRLRVDRSFALVPCDMTAGLIIAMLVLAYVNAETEKTRDLAKEFLRLEMQVWRIINGDLDELFERTFWGRNVKDLVDSVFDEDDELDCFVG